MPICVDLIISFQLKAECYRSLLGNPTRSAGMKENECQGCLFPNSWRVCPCGAVAPTIPQGGRERLRDGEGRDDILDGWAEPCQNGNTSLSKTVKKGVRSGESTQNGAVGKCSLQIYAWQFLPINNTISCLALSPEDPIRTFSNRFVNAVFAV